MPLTCITFCLMCSFSVLAVILAALPGHQKAAAAAANIRQLALAEAHVCFKKARYVIIL